MRRVVLTVFLGLATTAILISCSASQAATPQNAFQEASTPEEITSLQGGLSEEETTEQTTSISNGALWSENTATTPAIGTSGMVSSANLPATQAGLDILSEGGNAFDAAVGVAAALNVVEPMMSGIGGYGAIVIYGAKKVRRVSLTLAPSFLQH